MLKRSCVCVSIAALLGSLSTFRERVIAQTTRPTASVSVRRLSTLTSRVVTGDFNGDGFIDLASTAVGAKAIVIALGNGDGTFHAPLSTGANGGVLAAGDFNKDGRLHLIADLDATDM